MGERKFSAGGWSDEPKKIGPRQMSQCLDWMGMAICEIREELDGMNTWAPIFSKIVHSSLWSEPDYVIKIFLTMLAKKDANQIVNANAFEIGDWAKKTEAEAIEALRILSSPDTRRIEPQPNEGRRIKKVEGGYLILNGQYYEDLMKSQKRKGYKRDWQTNFRAKKNPPLPGEVVAVRMVKNGATQEEMDRHQTMSQPDKFQEEPPRRITRMATQRPQNQMVVLPPHDPPQ